MNRPAGLQQHRRCCLALVLLLGLLGTPGTALAWTSREHKEIATSAYLGACELLTGSVAVGNATVTDTGALARLDMVCGPNVKVAAALYGDAAMLAGDFLSEPGEFASPGGAWRFRSNKSYYLLALENGAHFHPMATRSWRDHHETAVGFALSAAGKQGLAMVAELELAFYDSAFADHFLQDAFCAGHMGFNRIASSAAASKAFHDTWNARGRVVTDRAGRRWVTFGDGLLDSPQNEEGRRRVIEASTVSVLGVLRAFVTRQPSPQEELAAWRSLPFTIAAPELPVALDELLTEPKADRQMWPLAGLLQPARKDLVGHLGFWSAAPFGDPDEATTAAMVALDLALAFVPAQSHLGVGGTVQEPGGQNSPVVDTGVLIPVGLSVEGLLSHQVNAGAFWLLRQPVSAIVHLDYQVNVELGTFLIGLHLGLSEFFPHPRTGWYGALGIGSTFSAAGGGGF